MLELSVVPVINENDVVAVDEIEGAKIGDNDNLSALVANLVDADVLVLLTDTGGLHTADPRRDPMAELIARVDRIDPRIEALAGGVFEGPGVGGMATKLQAARLATGGGADTVIAAGAEADVLVRLAAGEPIGTLFPATVTRMESRKRWILSGLAGKAAAHIDDGAAMALKRGRSLLPAGIVNAKGPFDRGDSVNIVGPEGKAVACGVANYSAADLQRIKGRRSGEITQILGYHFGDEVIHRNNVVML